MRQFCCKKGAMKVNRIEQASRVGKVSLPAMQSGRSNSRFLAMTAAAARKSVREDAVALPMDKVMKQDEKNAWELRQERQEKLEELQKMLWERKQLGLDGAVGAAFLLQLLG